MAETASLTGIAAAGPPVPALYSEGRLYFSYIKKSDNKTYAAVRRGSTTDSFELRSHTGSADIHNSAGIAIDADGHLWAATLDHSSNTAKVWIHRSGTPQDINFFKVAEIGEDGGKYPQILIDSTGKMWVFYNYTVASGATRHIGLVTSDDKGETWSSNTQIWQSTSGDWAYFTATLIDDKPHLLVVKDAPVNSHTLDGYFLRWDGTNWVEADGTSYTLPVTAASAEVCFDASSAGGSLGYFPFIQKDSSGDYFFVTDTWNSSNVRDALYFAKFASGSWTQSEILSGTVPNSSVIPKLNDEYSFIFIQDGGNHPAVRATSSDSGATWSTTTIASTALTRTRAAAKPIVGIQSTDHVDEDDYALWFDETRSGSYSWTSDLYLPFNATNAGASGSHVATLTIDADQVTGTPEDVLIRVNMADFPSTFWDSVGVGGAGIRVYEDDDTTERAFAVIHCDKANEQGYMLIRRPGVTSDSVDADLHVHTGYDDGHIHSGTYGCEAALTDFAGYYPLHGRFGVDLSGNGRHLDFGGDPGSRTGPITGTKAVDFDGSSDYAEAAATSAYSLLASGTLWTVELSFYWDALNSSSDGFGNQLLRKGDGSSEWAINLDERKSGTGLPAAFRVSTFGSNNLSNLTEDVTTGQWYFGVASGLAGTRYGSSVSGGLSSPGASDTSASGGEVLSIAREIAGGADSYFNGAMFGIGISNAVERDSDYVQTTRANINSPSTFYNVTAVGGSTTVEADDVSQGQTIDSVALTQTQAIGPQSLSQSATIAQVSLTQTQAVSPNALLRGSAIDQVALLQAHVIQPFDIAATNSIDGTNLTQAGSLNPDAFEQSASFDQVGITQDHSIAPSDLSHGVSIDQALLTVAGSISVQGLSHAQVLEAVTLVQDQFLAPNGITTDSEIDTAALSVGGATVTPEAVSQSATLDASAITQYQVIAPDSLTQQQFIDALGAGAVVVGELEGQIVMYAALSGNIIAIPALAGTIH